MGKKFNKKPKKIPQLEIVPKDENPILEPSRFSDAIVPKKVKWTNRQRVLVFAARGINHRDRHLLRDIKTLMPHHRADSKMERSKSLSIVNDMCSIRHCNKAILFEGRRKKDLYMWISNVPNGPSAKFLLENVHTMGELKLTGNCLRGSRPLLSFDPIFEELPHLSILKETLSQIFGVPYHHPKSQPFIDHVYTFTYIDKRIWFRNFQILSEDGALAEVGPRFVMNPVKIFEGSFNGNVIWDNPDYVSPSRHRQMLKKSSKNKYVNRMEQKANYALNAPKDVYKFNDYDCVFEGDNPITTAQKIAENLKQKKTISEQQKDDKKAKLTEKIEKKQLNAVKQIMEQRKGKAKEKKQQKKSMKSTL